jgi:nicotinamidase-related amidase
MKTALLVIDVQTGLFSEQPWNAASVLTKIESLISAARTAGAAVIFVRDSRVNPDGALHARLVVNAGDPIIDKSFCDAFLETRLHGLLEERDIERLVVVGLQSEYCVDTTCRRAASLGYKVTLVADAHTTFDNAQLMAEQIVAHHNLVLSAFPAGSGCVHTVPSDQVRFP